MNTEDLSYSHNGTTMLGRFFAPEGGETLPAVMVIHGAHGLNGFILGVSETLAAQGYAVLALDLWGGREQLADPAEIGPRLGAMASDRGEWMARVEAARRALAAQPQVDPGRIGALGYCFGGTTVLEYLRTGGGIAAGVSLHGGLDMVADDWSAAAAPALICTGDRDPMAKSTDVERLTNAMTDAGMTWELHLYGGVRHAFTEPDAPGRPPFARYDARADRRSWAAMSAFFQETLA